MKLLDNLKKEFNEGNLGGVVGGALGGAGKGLISDGFSSGAGDVMGTLGAAASAIPGPWGLALSAGLQLGGGAVNRLFGTKVDQEALKEANQGTNYLNNFTSNSNTFDGIEGPATQSAIGNIYKGGVFNKGAARDKNLALLEARDRATLQAERQVDNNVSNLVNNQIGDMYSNLAFGGWLNSNGTDWPLGFSTIENGGTHEQNPLGGVLMGVSEDGQPNLVEEGEVKWNDYMFSDRLKLSKNSKKRLGFKYGGPLTYAKAAEKFGKKLEERPHDFITKAGYLANMGKLREDQENVRQKMEEKQAMNEAMAAYGGPIKKKYKDWYKTVPTDRNNTKDYNLEKAYEVLPEEVLESWRTYDGPEDGAPHLPTVYYNEDADEYEFLKSSKHPTLNEELKWYNSKDPEAVEFRKNYKLDKSGEYYKYIRRQNKNNSYAYGGHVFDGGGFSSAVKSWYDALTPEQYNELLNGIQWNNKVKRDTYANDREALWKYAFTGKPGRVYNGISDYFNKFNSPSKGSSTLNFPPMPPLYSPSFKLGPSLGHLAVPSIYPYTNFISPSPIKYSPKKLTLKGQLTPPNISYNPYKNQPWKQPINTDFEDTVFQNRKGTLLDTRSSLEKWMDNHVQNPAKEPFVSKRGEYSTSDTTSPYTYTSDNPSGNTQSNNYNWLTGLRYAPVVGAGISVLSDLAGWTNKADYSNARLLENAARNIREVNPAYIGDYAKPKYFDRLFYGNELQQNANSGYRNLANMAGGNSATAAANTIAAMSGAQRGLGETYLKGDLSNREQDLNVFDRNQRTNMFNAENYLKAQMAGVDKDRTYLDAMSRSAAIRDAIDQRIGAARSLNLTNLFDSLGNIGREEFSREMINSNPAWAYSIGRDGNVSYRGSDWLRSYDDYINGLSRACGGHLTIKNKRRRR